MKVKELIEHLKKQNPKLDVYLEYEGLSYPLLKQKVYPYTKRFFNKKPPLRVLCIGE